MKHTHYTKLLALVLAVITLLSTFSLSVLADDEETTVTSASAEATLTSSEEVVESTGLDSFYSDSELEQIVAAYDYPYQDYSERHANKPAGTETVVIDATEYNAEKTTADVYTIECDGKMGLYSPVEGDITYTINVPASGKYAFKVEYYQTEGDTTIVERGFQIDGDYPFSESRYIYFPRLWVYDYDEEGNFRLDKNGNDFRPVRVEEPQWYEYNIRDWLGYESEPFEFYLTEGEHDITLMGSREPIIYGTITMFPVDDVPTYEEFLENCKEKGIEEVTGVTPVVVQGEKPALLSSQTILPTVDRTSCYNDPQDAANLLYNCLSANNLNQFVVYKATVEKSGLYRIAVRYRQNGLIGMFCSRKVFINGEYQFKESSRCRFVYSPYWQIQTTNDGTTEFLFYLEEGENEIMLETVLGDFAQYCYEVRNIADELTSVYYEIVKIAGIQPDPYRDYGFGRIMPEVLDTMAIASKRLYEIADIFVEMTGDVSEPTAILQTSAWLYNEMARDEYKIASNFITYKKYVLALYDWVNTCMTQKVLVDKLIIQAPEDKLPKATANAFEQIWFECKAFVASFFMDYTSIGFEEDAEKEYDSSVTLWSSVSSTTTRETMLILRQYTDEYFTPKSNIAVNIEVVSAGLTEAILAGIGPDIAFMDSSTAVSWGLRGGVEDVSKLEGYEDIYSEFGDAIMEAVKIEDETYGLPVALAYNAVFYRADILDELNLKVPDTWDEVVDVLPLLQNQNMELGLTYWLANTITTNSTATAGAATVVSATTVNQLANLYVLIQQSGGSVYADDGMRVGVDSVETLAAFETWCNFYTKYGTQPTYDITRFRLGEVPIVVGDLFSTYNTLMSYNEIRGLWGIAPIFGTTREDGTVDRSNIVSVTNCIVIPDGCDDVNAAWEYIKWYAGYEGQSVLTREAISVQTAVATTKVSTANIKVLLEEPWTNKEITVVKETLNELVGIANYPGSYLVNSQINFAFYEVFNTGVDAGVSLLDRINTMNKELSRKRQEYGLDYYEIDYSGKYTEDMIVRQ